MPGSQDSARIAAWRVHQLHRPGANLELPIIGVAAMASRVSLARAGEPLPSVRTPVRRDHLRKAVLAALGKNSTPAQAARAAATRLPNGTHAVGQPLAGVSGIS
jgi:hypothetical protein